MNLHSATVLIFELQNVTYYECENVQIVFRNSTPNCIMICLHYLLVYVTT
jgi:hypothetical protein